MEHVQVQRQIYDSTADRAAAQPMGAACGLLGTMLHRWRTRQDLLNLTDAELHDIGLTWEQARKEGSKPFWRR